MGKESPLDRTLQDSLLFLRKSKGAMTLRAFLKQMAGKGASVVIIFLTLPFCLPIHLPGLSTPFGIVIALVGLQILFGRAMWLPKSLLEKKLSPAFLKKVIRRSLSLMRKLKHLIRPRLLFLSGSGVMRAVHGFTTILLGLLLALPLPIPTTNLGFAWPLLFLNAGFLERDGLFILVGYFCFALYVAFLVGVTYCSLRTFTTFANNELNFESVA